MVLPFGLNSNGEQVTNRTLITPTAPPIETDNNCITDGTIVTNATITTSNSNNCNNNPYVDFIIINGNDRHVIRTEKKTILESSVELAKIINSGSSSLVTATTASAANRKNDNYFYINDVDKNDFELVIRYLETKFIKFNDHQHILRILEIADRFNCPDLIIHCVKELDLQLSSLIVLDVFRSLWYYNCISPPSTRNNNTIITQEKKTKDKKSKNRKKLQNQENQNNHLPFTPEEYLAALLNNTLQLIDMQAELILTKNEMLQLRFEELEMIVKREALQIQSEIVLFICLANWSIEECKRKKLDLTAENRRRVLGSLCYTPRYLLMSQNDFQRCCDRVELLDPSEIALVNDALNGKKLINLTIEQNKMLELFKTPRPQYAKLPIYLSDRTNPKNYCKKMRKAEKNPNNSNYDNNKSSCCQAFGLNCLSVIACIFD